VPGMATVAFSTRAANETTPLLDLGRLGEPDCRYPPACLRCGTQYLKVRFYDAIKLSQPIPTSQLRFFHYNASSRVCSKVRLGAQGVLLEGPSLHDFVGLDRGTNTSPMNMSQMLRSDSSSSWDTRFRQHEQAKILPIKTACVSGYFCLFLCIGVAASLRPRCEATTQSSCLDPAHP